MTRARLRQWTEAEVHRLRTLAKRKVSADNIAKSLGRYVGSVKIKARELSLILSRKAKSKRKVTALGNTRAYFTRESLTQPARCCCSGSRGLGVLSVFKCLCPNLNLAVS